MRKREFHGLFSAIAQDSALLVLTRVLGMLSGLVLMIMLARMLAPTEFGAVAVAFSIALIGGLLTTLNIGAGALRFMTGYAVRGDKASAAAYLKCGDTLVIRSALFIWIALALAIVADHTWDWFPSLPLHLAAGAAAAPLFGWLRVRAANVTASGSVVRAFVPNAVIRPLLMLSMVSGAYAFYGNLDGTTVLASYLLAALVVCIIQYPLFRKHLPLASIAPITVERQVRRQWVRVGIDLLIPTLFLDLSVDTIIIISSLALGSEQTAILAIVLRIQAIILFGVTSINMVVGPRIAKAHNSGERQLVNHLLRVSAHLKLWPSVLILGFLAFFGESVLAIFGSEYESEILPLVILSVRPIVMAVFGPVVLFVTILGLQREANRIFLLAIVLLVLLILIFGYFFDVAGVAFAVVIVWVLWHFLLYLLIREHSDYRILQPRYRFRAERGTTGD